MWKCIMRLEPRLNGRTLYGYNTETHQKDYKKCHFCVVMVGIQYTMSTCTKYFYVRYVHGDDLIVHTTIPISTRKIVSASWIRDTIYRQKVPWTHNRGSVGKQLSENFSARRKTITTSETDLPPMTATLAPNVSSPMVGTTGSVLS